MDKGEFIKGGFEAIKGLNGSWILVQGNFDRNPIGIAPVVAFSDSNDLMEFLRGEFHAVNVDGPGKSKD